MSYFASVNGLQIVGGLLVVPLVGVWTADLYLATSQEVSGSVQVVIGNLTLQGFVYRSETYGGQVRARLVGGYGGWRTPIAAQGYGSTQGVKLSTVLQDAAAACGEQLQVFADVTIGQAFVRAAFVSSVASDVLWQMLALGYMSAWHVNPEGATVTGPWPTTAVSTPFMPTDQRPEEGLVEIATEDYASWMPGATFSHPLLHGTYTSAGVQYVWDEEGTFRFEVLTATTGPRGVQDRVLGPVQQLVERQVAPLRFFGRYGYTISNPQAGPPATIDGAPVDKTLGLPDVQNVQVTADSLATYTPPSGGRAHIMFVDGDPTQPVCVWTEASSQNGPTAITIGPQGSGVADVARVTDTCIVMFPPLIQVAGTIAGAPFVGVATITTPAIGTIQTGSSLLQAAQS
jgi:hypothetical protein